MKIVKIEKDKPSDVYNMEVEKHHNYIIEGGFILHNCDGIRYFCAGRPRAAVIEPENPNREYQFVNQIEGNDLALW